MQSQLRRAASILSFNWGLFLLVPMLLWRGANLVLAAIGVVLAGLLFLNRSDVAAHSPLPDWVWLVPVVFVVAWGLMDANFSKWEAQRDRAEMAEGKLETLKHSLRYMLSIRDVAFGFFAPPGVTGRSIKVGVVLRNNSTIPLRYERQRMQVVVGGRTIAHPVFGNEGGVIDAAGGTEVYFFPPIPEIPDQMPLSGTIECEFRFGPALGETIWIQKWSASFELGEMGTLPAPVSLNYTMTRQECVAVDQSMDQTSALPRVSPLRQAY